VGTGCKFKNRIGFIFKLALNRIKLGCHIENGITIFNKPNISPSVFEVLLKYFYTGVISIENNEISLVDIAIASDELQLLEVYKQVEERLLENKLVWKPREIITIFHLFQHTNLYNIAIGLVSHFMVILPDGLNDEMIQYFSDPNSNPSFKILPLRGYPFESKIINVKDAGLIAKWCRIKIENDERSSLLSYSNDFDHRYKTSNSFIFSLTNREFPILSRASSKNDAIIWCRNKGPCFGLQDLCITSLRPNNIICKSVKHSYEKKVISRETFEIEEYEVFQIVDERFSQYINSGYCGL
ncbi:40708_t:CDS:2, partial [Gigaspora margarita]